MKKREFQASTLISVLQYNCSCVFSDPVPNGKYFARGVSEYCAYAHCLH